MIIDSHAYCFSPLGNANGFPSTQAHLDNLQREMAGHHQPAWRLRDGITALGKPIFFTIEPPRLYRVTPHHPTVGRENRL